MKAEWLNACVWFQGYRTGHVYHDVTVRNNQKRERINSDIEYPPVATSFAAMYDGDADKL